MLKKILWGSSWFIIGFSATTIVLHHYHNHKTPAVKPKQEFHFFFHQEEPRYRIMDGLRRASREV